MVRPTMGTVIMCFLASSTPLRMASGTSPALPSPAPTRPWPSPTTTSALKEKRRPPLTTLATRGSETIFSVSSLPRSPPRSSRRSMRIAISELQSCLAGGLGESGHAAVVEVPTPVENDLGHPDGQGANGDQLADHGGRPGGRPAAPDAAHRLGVLGRGRGQGAPGRVIDHLGGDVVEAAVDAEARARRRAGDPTPNPQGAARARP